MTSKSRAAQEQLALLEKQPAPFEDQLVEATKFIGIGLNDIGRPADGVQEESKAVLYHGREEWLLRWLLKRLQAPGDEVPRRTPSSWRLFRYLVKSLPVTNAARILVERQFISILRRTLEEAQKAGAAQPTKVGSDSSATEQEIKKSSKKRRRSGELVSKLSSHGETTLPVLLDAVFSALDVIVQNTKTSLATSEEQRTSAFSADYMKTVIRATSEEAATVLGLWLSLCHSTLPLLKGLGSVATWLSPFIDIWESHTSDENSHLQFSLHATRPLLNLLRSLKNREGPSDIQAWNGQLERLVARNIVMPAKAGPELLETITKASVLQNTGNAPLLLEIAIRSVQVTSSARRRRAQDEKFLQSMFTSLKESMSQISGESNNQISAMLRLAIDHKLGLDLAVLRSITASFALSDWDLLATIIELDANVFLLGEEGVALLTQLLAAITKASASQSWSEIQNEVVSTVLVPLMREFAKARDLTGFVRHWFAQLVEYEKRRKNVEIDALSAWEDEALQVELGKRLEATLTIPQIIQILDWLAEEVKEHPDAVCVILEAIARSVSGEESVVDAIGLRLYHIMFDNGVANKLTSRYKWRSWNIISYSLRWMEYWDVDKLALEWDKGARPFRALSSFAAAKSVLGKSAKQSSTLESLEVFRFSCTAWNAAKKERKNKMQELGQPMLLNMLHGSVRDVRQLLADLQGDVELGNEVCDSKVNTLERGKGWLVWSLARCLFVEHPEVLILFLEIDEDVCIDLLQLIFWIASASFPENNSAAANNWLRSNQSAFPELWRHALSNDTVLSHRKLTKFLISTMLDNETNINNPLMKVSGNNQFAISCLNNMVLDDIPKEDRSRIVSSWLPPKEESEPENAKELSYASTILDRGVLALKRKVMRRPKLYEGMTFQELIDLADTLADSSIPSRFDNLVSLEELAHLTFISAHQNIEQARSKTYVSDAFKRIQKKVNKASEKKKHRLNFSQISIFGVALKAFQDKGLVLHDLDLVRTEDLQTVVSTFKDSILVQLKDALCKPGKAGADAPLLVFSIIEALTALGVEAPELADLQDDAITFVASVGGTEFQVGDRLQTFLLIYGPGNITEPQLEGDITTVYGRECIIAKTRAAIAEEDNIEKFKMLQQLLGESSEDLTRLDKLVAAREVIISIEDTRKPKKGVLDDSDSEDDEEETFSLTEAYTILSTHLRSCTDVRQFKIIVEILQLMLKSKRFSITQYNIDSTLGSITHLCSPSSPPLSPIYTHLCSLLLSILTHQRLKLKGHAHLTQQALSALLRCLFRPLSHHTSKTSKLLPPPTWLASYPLDATHATAFTKLITSICDPTVSAVQGTSSTLTSEKDKAKRIAAQYMKFILQEYIRGQLEMKMLPEVREKVVLGMYSILGTFTEEVRNAVREELDASGRAVFIRLYGEWRRWEKVRG